MPTREFHNDALEPGELTTFVLSGETKAKGEPWREVFTCVDEAPAGVLADLAACMIVRQNGDVEWNQVSILSFMRGVLIDADVRRFDDLVHDKDRVVKIQVLGDLTLWLAEELVGRPTSGLSPSGDGGQPARATSQAGSPWPASMPAR